MTVSVNVSELVPLDQLMAQTHSHIDWWLRRTVTLALWVTPDSELVLVVLVVICSVWALDHTIGSFINRIAVYTRALWQRQAAQRAGAAGVFTRAAPLSASLSVPFKNGVNCRQSSDTVSLWGDAACTIWPSGTGTATNQGSNFIYFGYISASGVKIKSEKYRICVVISSCLSDAEEIAHVESAFCRWITESWPSFWVVFKR